MAQTVGEDYGPSREENGRGYGTGRGAEYLLPIDSMERERLDVVHTMLKTAREPQAKLLHAPVTTLEQQDTPPDRRPRVMDLACGTGVWLLEMAEKYRHVEFHGYDINRLAPSQLLPNIEIHCPVDIEEPWTNIPFDWDLIRLQLGLGAIRDWATLYQQIRRYLKPGTGWFEGVEIDWEPRFQDDAVPSNSRLSHWWKELSLGYQWLGFPINYSTTTKQALMHVGFRDIECREYMIPLSGWNKTSNRLQRSGMWCNIAMSTGHNQNYGLEAMTLRSFTNVQEWPTDHIRRYCREVMEEASDSSVRAYFKLFVWWARAPHPSEMSDARWAEIQGD